MVEMVDSKDSIITLIDMHLTNVRELMRCLDSSEKRFKEQLQDEYRYFSDIRLKFNKNIPASDSVIRVLENKLERYKKSNKYRYNIAKKIVNYNNYLHGKMEDVPF